MTEKIKNDRVRASASGRRRIALVLIAVGVLVTVFNYGKMSSVTSSTSGIRQQLEAVGAEVAHSAGAAAADLGREVGQAAANLGRDVGQAAAGVGRDVGNSIRDVLAPAAPAPSFTWIWPMLLVLLGLALIFRRPARREKSKNEGDDFDYEPR